ncbi:AAA domain-containing protein [Halomonas sp. LS-001]
MKYEYTQVKEGLNHWRKFCASESLWLTLFGFLPMIAKRRRLKRQLFIDEYLDEQTQDILAQNSSTSPEKALQLWLAQHKESIQQYQQFIDTLKQLQQQVQQAHLELETAYRALYPDDPLPDFFDAFDQSLDTSLRFQLFELATHYWESRWLEECKARHKELAEQTAKKTEKTGLKSVLPRWRRRMMLTPCIVSTLYSLPKHMIYSEYLSKDDYRFYYLINKIDLLIIDEAGQVAPEVAGASMALAKRVLAIGDVHQIKPVSQQLPSVDIGNLMHEKLIADNNAYEALQDGGRCVVNGSVMRIAQTTSQYHYLPDAEPGMFLHEHRRCLSSIIAYCNELCYKGLLQPLRDTPAVEPALPPFGYVHVDGRAEKPPTGSRINRQEAITIAEWLLDIKPQLEKTHGKTLEEIVGVVTPFKAQANLIEEECRTRGIRVDNAASDLSSMTTPSMTAPSMTIGTVHALQGAERPIVVFSGVYSRHEDGNFIDQDPSLLNVAVSRAKDSFIVFGDMDVIATAAYGSPRQLLGNYLFSCEDNELNYIASSVRPDLQSHCKAPRMINDSHEHDQCLKDLLNTVQHRVDIVSPWISLERLQTTGLLEALSNVAQRGVKATIFVDHHFNTTNGNQPCETKNKRFRHCCETLAANGLKVYVVNQVHSKMVMADKQFMIIGSYNWGSAVREGKYKNMETSVFLHGDLSDEISLQLEALKGRIYQTFCIEKNQLNVDQVASQV